MTHCPDKREIWHGPVYQDINMRIQPPKLKIWTLVITVPLRGGDSFARFLENIKHLYASRGSFYIFNLVAFEGQINQLYAFLRSGAFFH